jgi:hypothetical protein
MRLPDCCALRWGFCAVALACGAFAQNAPEPKPDVAGVTVDSKGAPLRKSDLMLVTLATNAVGEPLPSYSAVTGSDGKFEFYSVPPGRYRLRADHAGYLRANYGAKTPWGSGSVLTVKAGAPITGIKLSMAEQAVIAGKVQYDGTAGSLNMMLLQERYDGGRRQLTTINSAAAEIDGEFRFNKLTPGRYYLAARPSTTSAEPGFDEAINVTTFYPGKADQSAAEAIVVKGGETATANFTVAKARCFRVSGSVGIAPPAGARLSVNMRSAAESMYPFSSSIAVGADGGFQFNSVPAGAYVITSTVPGATPTMLRQTIDLQADMSGVFLKPEQAAVVRGTLKIENSAVAFDGMRLIQLRGAPPLTSGYIAQIAPDGSFTFGAVPPGRYRYQFSQQLQGMYLKSAKFGDKDAFGEVDLTEPAPDARLELVYATGGAQIAGVVLDEKGKPAEGIVCLIPDPPRPEAAALYLTAEAGEGGKFQFQNVRPGKYRVYAWEELETGAQMDPRLTAANAASSVAVELEDSGRKSVTVTRIPVP